eukprot:TRINITY_DN51355_c0_g1_i1.p2 TRINITY_DN51355_c0_g1~~TRINITY_DN51355_c0_g1_i1.p2  ORF type:complete len:129 (-),score=24.64 TRINITY_DN51355_c0_g1_i1:122-508(-)
MCGIVLFGCVIVWGSGGVFFFLVRRRRHRSTLSSSSAASDVYKRQEYMGFGAHIDHAAEDMVFFEDAAPVFEIGGGGDGGVQFRKKYFSADFLQHIFFVQSVDDGDQIDLAGIGKDRRYRLEYLPVNM